MIDSDWLVFELPVLEITTVVKQRLYHRKVILNTYGYFHARPFSINNYSLLASSPRLAPCVLYLSLWAKVLFALRWVSADRLHNLSCFRTATSLITGRPHSVTWNMLSPGTENILKRIFADHTSPSEKYRRLFPLFPGEVSLLWRSIQTRCLRVVAYFHV